MTLDPVSGGGTAERTIQMSKSLVKSGVECKILTLDLGLTPEFLGRLKNIKITALPCINRRFYFPKPSPGLFKIVMDLVRDADLIHMMGHWTMINALVYFSVRRFKKPYVVCPAGAMPLFGRSKWLKRLYNFIVGRRIMRNASAWIAITPAEISYFESFGIPASRVTVIPNGISQEDFPKQDTKDFRYRKGLSDHPIILFMGRLNTIKGPDLLMKAFLSTCRLIPNFHLVFAGPDEGMQNALFEMGKQGGISERVHFLGYVGGDEKAAAYHAASVLVVPSRQEAMSIVVLEAGICGTPVLVTDQCGFGEIKSLDPALEVPASSEGIANGLIYLLTRPGKREELATSFRKFVSQRYSWDVIIEKYLHLYRGLLNVSGIK